MAKQVVVLVKDKARQYEALRTSLGLILENHQVSMCVLDHEVEMTEEYSENVALFDEMEGARFSDQSANAGQHGFRELPLPVLVKLLRESEIVIPF